jgi:hypothetical protein
MPFRFDPILDIATSLSLNKLFGLGSGMGDSIAENL